MNTRHLAASLAILVVAPSLLALTLVIVTGRVFLVAPVSAIAAGGREPPADVPDGMEWSPDHGLRSDVLDIDAESIAEEMGWSKASTKARLRAQLKMDDVLPVLLERYPSFAGIYWVEGASVVAQFTKAAPDEAIELLESTGATVSAEVVALSATELEAIHADVVGTLRSLVSGDGLWAVGIDPERNAVVVTLDRSAGVSPSELTSALPERAQAADVRISVATGPIVKFYTTRGGAELEIGSDFQCTSGFTVAAGGTDGVATAGHCTNAIDNYHDPFNSVNHSATYQDGFVGNWGDFQWHTTSGTEVDDFFHNNNGAVRDVTGVKNTFTIGESVTAYGRGDPAGNETGKVKYINYSIPEVGRQVCTGKDMMGYGDSGGPVYQVGVAAGYVMGAIFIDGAWRFCFSQARYIDDAIGVSIKQ